MLKNRPVLAFLGGKLRHHLQSLLPQAIFHDSWDTLTYAVSRAAQPVVIFDPSRDDSAVQAIRVRERFTSTAFVMYTTLDPRAFQNVAGLIRGGFTEVVLFGFDDQRARIERLLLDVALRIELQPYLSALAPRLLRLPARLRSAVEEMIREPRSYRSTQDLAVAAQMSTRAVFRHLRAAGFPSPRRLVVSARVVRAYLLLSGNGRSAQEVASLLGYPSTDQLSAHLAELCGCTASDVKRGLSPEAFFDSMVTSLTKHSSLSEDREWAQSN